jgi:protein phosphatase
MLYTLYLQDEDIDRPLLSENRGDHSRQSNIFLGSSVGEPSKIQTNRSNTSPRSHAITDTGRIYPAECCATQGMHNHTQPFSSLVGVSAMFSSLLDCSNYGFTKTIFQLLIISTDFVGETHVINVENDTSEEFRLGSTLKRTPLPKWPTPDQKHRRRVSGEDNHNGSVSLKDNTYRKLSFKLDLDILIVHCFQRLAFICPFHPIFC